jgi:hypothetical protein
MILFKTDHYKSIDDLPIFNWNKVNETNDLRWLLKKQSEKKLYNRQKNVLEAAWNGIFKEFVDAFGIPEQMLKVLEIKRDIAVLNADIILTGDMVLQTFIEIKQHELKELLTSDVKTGAGEVKVYVEKYMGFKLNERETTVREFYHYLELIKKEAVRNEQVKERGSI